MKLTKITLSIALIGALTLGMAEETTASTDTTVSVDAQIEAIQAAPAQERIELMNEFKQKLMQMNQEERMAAIQEMQTKMQTKAAGAQDFGMNTAGMAQDMASHEGQEFGDMTKTRAQDMQMQTNEQMNQVQNMVQQQAGNQYMQTVGAAGAAGSANYPTMNTDMMQRR